MLRHSDLLLGVVVVPPNLLEVQLCQDPGEQGRKGHCAYTAQSHTQKQGHLHISCDVGRQCPMYIHVHVHVHVGTPSHGVNADCTLSYYVTYLRKITLNSCRQTGLFAMTSLVSVILSVTGLLSR